MFITLCKEFFPYAKHIEIKCRELYFPLIYVSGDGKGSYQKKLRLILFARYFRVASLEGN